MADRFAGGTHLSDAANSGNLWGGRREPQHLRTPTTMGGNSRRTAYTIIASASLVLLAAACNGNSSVDGSRSSLNPAGQQAPRRWLRTRPACARMACRTSRP